ncbi:MAG TPA: MFS transporter [Candidatus Limnocylindrales bacterium]|nr:MFS transporter [Candidatus Limnocylindrales bacterium]
MTESGVPVESDALESDVIDSGDDEAAGESALAVFRNRTFLRLWLSQAATQIGGNMVLFGLTVIVSENNPNTAVSLLILSFLVPAVLFSAVAGVYVDRIDRRLVLVATNILRAIAIIGLFLVGDHLLFLLLLNLFVSTVTVFFAPAEAAMIPEVVPRRQLLAANGVFTLTLNAAFALGFALLGPLVINIAGPQAVILVVAALYFLAGVFCWTLPPSPPPAHANGGVTAVGETQAAVESTVAQLREGFGFIQANRSIAWSLLYLGITASLIGVLGVLGPDFAQTALGLRPKDIAVIVLPLGAGIVMGILLLNTYGKFLPRRRVIEGGLVVLGVALALLSVAGPISAFLQRVDRAGDLLDLSAITSLLAIVVFIAFIAGIAYAAVAIPSQTQLQEDLPEDVRGRVFGVLNMLVSVSSFLPIIVVGPISDLIGTAAVMLVVAIGVLAAGIASVFLRDPNLAMVGASADPHAEDPIAAALGADRPAWRDEANRPSAPPPPPPWAPPGPADPADRD